MANAPVHGEIGRRPIEMEVRGAKSGEPRQTAYEDLFQQWLNMRSLTDSAERAVEQHRRVVPDQPLLRIFNLLLLHSPALGERRRDYSKQCYGG